MYNIYLEICSAVHEELLEISAVKRIEAGMKERGRDDREGEREGGRRKKEEVEEEGGKEEGEDEEDGEEGGGGG